MTLIEQINKQVSSKDSATKQVQVGGNILQLFNDMNSKMHEYEKQINKISGENDALKAHHNLIHDSLCEDHDEAENLEDNIS